MKTKIKHKTPMECSNMDDVCSIPRDNVTVGDFWILSDGHWVSIHEQKAGCESTQKITLPKATFDKLIRWYATGCKRGKIEAAP